MRLVVAGELERFDAELDAHHWLGHRLTGRVLRYVATVGEEWVAVAGFGSAALVCTVREDFLGWDRELRRRRLGLITSNQRFCVLPAGRRPNLTSAVLGGCLRRLPVDHRAVWGQPVLVVETGRVRWTAKPRTIDNRAAHQRGSAPVGAPAQARACSIVIVAASCATRKSRNCPRSLV